MIAIERSSRQLLRRGERMQLGEALVADQVRPQSAVGGPDRIVDENGHAAILGRGHAPRLALRHRLTSGKLVVWCETPVGCPRSQEKSCVRTRRSGDVRKQQSSREIPGAFRSPTKQV